MRTSERGAGAHAPARRVVRSAALVLTVVLLEIDAVGEPVLRAVQLPVFRRRETAVAQVTPALRFDAVETVVEAVVLTVRQRAAAHALVDAFLLVVYALFHFTVGAGGKRGDQRGEERGSDESFREHQMSPEARNSSMN